jgi:hypothetical protein
MIDPSFFSGVYGKPRIPGAMYENAPDQGYGGYSGSGTYVVSPDTSVPTSMNVAQQPSGFQGFLSSLQQNQQQRRQGGLMGAISAAQGGGLAGLAKFLI